ncbi:hypothetical protein J132_09262 [Termitomyces sp. J132]|nr:hypothetical protein J132_09262 [Termitomyces sp. J132]
MRTASPSNLDLFKALVPVFSAAFVVAAIGFYRTRYSSLRVPTSEPESVVTRSSSDQEPTREPGYDRLSLRETKPPNLKFNPTTIAQLTRKVNNSGLYLQVVQCRYKMNFDNITEGNHAIMDNLDVELPYRFPIDVSITQDVKWSTQNLGLLTKQLHFFWEALGDGQRCSNLTIQLPPVRLAEVTSGSGILAVTTDVLLPLNLRTLEWRGSREQLPMFFQDQPAFSTLTNLTVQSELSADDCKTLLYWGRGRLQSAAFQTIRDVDPGEVRVSLPPVPNRVQIIEMAALMSLAITSTVDIRLLLSTQMRFPAINAVTLIISDPGFDIWYCRQRLTTFGMRHVPSWNVHGRMSQDQVSRMNELYPDGHFLGGIPHL